MSGKYEPDLDLCVLCGKTLTHGETNFEHYLPATAIRNLDKLGIPPEWNWAARINQSYVSNAEEKIIAPKSQHKKWATVRVHAKCNADASPMCMDLKKIIDTIDTKPNLIRTDRITSYYAHLWGVAADKVRFRILDTFDTDQKKWLVYAPGLLSVGRIMVWAEHSQVLNDYQRHTIYLGEEAAIKGID